MTDQVIDVRDDLTIDVVVTAKRPITDDIVAITLCRNDHAPLPPWEPGAHVDLMPGRLLPGGRQRQYSLCGDPRDTDHWRIAVRREADGRGTSVFVHDSLAIGDRLQVRPPRNHFCLEPAAAYLFIAGGIGITPLLPMLEAAQRMGADWRLVYCGRDVRTMAFTSELTGYGDKVQLHSSAESGPLDLAALLEAPAPETLIYCCGPERLIEGVEAASAGWPANALHVERFAARPVAEPVHAEPFEVVLQESGLTLTVPPGRSILSVVEEAGIPVFTSCGEGTCGTCETAVLDGVPDHRDSVLTSAEREAGDCMLICVSRACTPRLVLDL